MFKGDKGPNHLKSPPNQVICNLLDMSNKSSKNRGLYVQDIPM
jgi:hypothetical protein